MLKKKNTSAHAKSLLGKPALEGNIEKKNVGSKNNERCKFKR